MKKLLLVLLIGLFSMSLLFGTGKGPVSTRTVEGVISAVVSAPTAGGTGYTVNDVLTVAGGSGGTVTATTVNAGVVAAVTLTTGGTGYTIGVGKATTGGTGTGCTIEITTVTGGLAWIKIINLSAVTLAKSGFWGENDNDEYFYCYIEALVDGSDVNFDFTNTPGDVTFDVATGQVYNFKINGGLQGKIGATGFENSAGDTFLPEKADYIQDTWIDWGTTNTEVSAVDIPIADAGTIITATDIEAALQENRTAIDLNTAKVTNVSTSLTLAAPTTTTVPINSDGSSPDITLIEATTSTAGILGSAKWNEIVANTAKTTNATHTGDVTGATALAIAEDIIVKADFKDEDWGDMTVSTNSVTLDEDVIEAANMANGDHGDFTYTTNVAALDTDVVGDAEIDWANVKLGNFKEQTAWRVFYSDTGGDVTELALGADNTFLMSNGAAAAPTFETIETMSTMVSDIVLRWGKYFYLWGNGAAANDTDGNWRFFLSADGWEKQEYVTDAWVDRELLN